MSNLSFDMRLKCRYSYATDDNKNLMCEIADKVCDGTVYMECQPDNCLYDSKSSCCYPIDDCKNCPIHPGNNDPYWGLTKSEYKDGVLTCSIR